MPEGGTLTIVTRCGRDLTAAPAVFVELTDTGTGILPEDLPHIFEPFFTTRGVASGDGARATGLGLAVSHGLVTAHGGTIDVRSEPGLGTTFTLQVPALRDEGEGAGAPPGTAEVPGARARRVLVAEDEPDIGAMIAEVLERQGHQVELVNNAEAAARLVQADSHDLVITDLLMPGGGGEMVLGAVAQLPQRPRVMVITGHIGDEMHARLDAQGVDLVLKKPFGVLELLRAVEGLIEASQPNS